MGVRKLLAKQKENFISLHEVLSRMSSTDNSSYEEAAQALSQSLKEVSTDGPSWYVFRHADGRTAITDSSVQEPYKCLEQAVSFGVAPERASDDEGMREFDELYGHIRPLDQFLRYGFDRGEITSFLKSLGVDIEGGIRYEDPEKASGTQGNSENFTVSFDSDFSEQLANCRNENLALKLDLEKTKGYLEEISDLKKNLKHMTKEHGELIKKLEKMTLDRDKYKQQIAIGKTKTSLLKLVGGLAIGYGLDIHAVSSKDVNKLLDCFSSIPISLGCDAMKKWLEEASDEIQKEA